MEHGDYPSPHPSMEQDQRGSAGLAVTLARTGTVKIIGILLLIVLISTWALITFIRPHANAILEEMITQYDKRFPEVTIRNGKASIKEEQPYFVNMGEIRNAVIAIDTREGHSDDAMKYLKKAEWGAVLTRDKLIVMETGNRTRILALSSMPDAVINSVSLTQWKRKYLPIVLWIATVLSFFYFLFAKPLQAAVFALIPYLAARRYGINLSFGEAFRISVFCLIPPVLFDLLIGFSGLQIPWAYVLYLVIYAAVLVLACRDLIQSRDAADMRPQWDRPT